MNKSIINVLIVIASVVILFGVLRFLNSGIVQIPSIQNITENFEPSQDLTLPQSLENDVASPYSGSVAPEVEVGQNKPQLTASELLPQDNASNEWAKANPIGSGSLKDTQFLQAGHHYGVNTVGQTLRNANMQLRSEPPNPQTKVSPWLQSTIDPDVNRKALEVGCGC
tara:strand:- start:3134 stop:3637 length:504 start_codon:yes stop_codon:yes gene_type:complete